MAFFKFNSDANRDFLSWISWKILGKIESSDYVVVLVIAFT